MEKGFAMKLWEESQKKVNRRLMILAAICVVASIVFLCATAHGQTGGGGAISNAPGFGEGTNGPAQNKIQKGLGGATLMNGAGAAVCGALQQWWCSLGFGFAGLTTGSVGYLIGYSGLPDGEYTMGGGGGVSCHNCKKMPSGGGGAFAAKLTIGLPKTHFTRDAFRDLRPRFDWRTTAVTAIQSNVLAPRYKLYGLSPERRSNDSPKANLAGSNRPRYR